MVWTQSFTPASSTDWLPRGTPASARRAQASAASLVISFGWLKWVLSHTGWYFLSMAHSLGVIRWGHTTGVREPSRMISTWGISRRRKMMYSSISSEIISTSPPDRRTSRTVGVLRMYSMHLSICSTGTLVSCWPAKRRRVQ